MADEEAPEKKAVAKVVAKKATAADEPDAKDAKDDAPDKPVSKAVEWSIAIAMMIVLVGFLFMMIYLMRSARSAVM